MKGFDIMVYIIFCQYTAKDVDIDDDNHDRDDDDDQDVNRN